MANHDDAYLVRLDDNQYTRLRFKFLPEGFVERKSAIYADVPVQGRSEPVKGYSHSSSREFELTLMFIATVSPFHEVIRPAQFVRSLTYPDYSANSPGTPPRLKLIIGRWLAQTVVATDISINYRAPWTTPPSTLVSAALSGLFGDRLSAVLTALQTIGSLPPQLAAIIRQIPGAGLAVSGGTDEGSGSLVVDALTQNFPEIPGLPIQPTMPMVCECSMVLHEVNQWKRGLRPWDTNAVLAGRDVETPFTSSLPPGVQQVVETAGAAIGTIALGAGLNLDPGQFF